MGQFNPGGPFSGSNPQSVDRLVTIQARNQMTRIYPLRTGQVTSYVAGDDGALKQGRPLAPGGNFLTLNVLNPINNVNNNRFCNDKGGNVYNGSDGSTANYAVDCLTGLGWYLVEQVNTASWSAAVAAAQAFTLGTYSGFRLPNWNEFASIINMDMGLSYGPFSFGSGNLYWASTTKKLPSGTTAYAFFSDANYGLVTAANKTDNNRSAAFIRTHFT